ncbi:MAG: hypothetical protein IJ719_07890 [Clostridia bacterium]|nr:hypothetical protein [Clostridia bacterium]
MRFIKCPRCELNYIPEDEEYCPVCKREMKGERHEELVELCSICNENPVMPGRDVCIECYKELTQQQANSRVGSVDDADEDETVDIGMEDVTDIDEIDLDDIQDDVPPELSDPLSLEDEKSKELELDDDEDEFDE